MAEETAATNNAPLADLASSDRSDSHLAQCDGAYWDYRNIGSDSAAYAAKECSCGLQAAKDEAAEALR